MENFGPEMNMQARNFNPPQNQQVIPPVPEQQPQSIREYLDMIAARRRQAETAGMPAENIVPTFTNIPHQAGQFSPAQGALEFSQIQPGGQVVAPLPNTGVIPSGPAARKEDQPITGVDPYKMAKERLQHLMPEMWSQMFPNRPPDAPLTKAEHDKWVKFVNHTNNLLIKKYEKKIEDAAKYVGKYSGISINKFVKTNNFNDLKKIANFDPMTIAQRASQAYDKMSQFDPIKKTMTKEEYIKNELSTMAAIAKGFNPGNNPTPKRQPTGGVGNQIPPELRPQVSQAFDLFKQLVSNGIPKDQAMQRIGQQFPQLVPYF